MKPKTNADAARPVRRMGRERRDATRADTARQVTLARREQRKLKQDQRAR